MRANEDSPTLTTKFRNEVTNQLGRFGIKAGRRFIQEEYPRLMNQRPSYGQLLAHSLTELAGYVIPALP